MAAQYLTTALTNLAATCGPFLRADEPPPPPPENTFLCNICYENLDESQQYNLRGGGGCNHQFCRECVGGWLSVRVNEGEITNSCPMAGCAAEASELDVEATCDPTTLSAYRKFRIIRGPTGHKVSCNDIINFKQGSN